jgi:hypothetical protein
MSKLDPRPPKKKELRSWEQLNELLQFFLSQPNDPMTTINVNDYAMSAEEIITEAEKQGYKVSRNGDHLFFS